MSHLKPMWSLSWVPQERSAPGAQSAQQAKEQSVFISKNTQELSCRTTPRTTLEASIRQRSTLLALPMNHGSVPRSLFTRSATSQRPPPAPCAATAPPPRAQNCGSQVTMGVAVPRWLPTTTATSHNTSIFLRGWGGGWGWASQWAGFASQNANQMGVVVKRGWSHVRGEL